jgi:hypothetical protein
MSSEKYEEPVDKIGKCQSNISVGLGTLGRINGVVVSFEPGNIDGVATGEKSDEQLQDRTVEDDDKPAHIPGAASEGRPWLVFTSQHALADPVDHYERSGKGPARVVVMPAEKFDSLTDTDRGSLRRLLEKGAVQAKGFRSLANDCGWPPGKIPNALDMAIVELVSTLPGLPVGQPVVLSEEQILRLVSYLRTLGLSAKVEILVEGMGTKVSHILARHEDGLHVSCIPP